LDGEMQIVTLDFETYYTKGLGFKTQTTEEYVRDRRFEVIGVSVKINEQPTTWFSGTKDETKEHLSKIDWGDSALLAHNTLFDGCILSWHFGINPAFLLDTLCMARAIHGVDAGGSLKALAIRYGIGEKGDEVIHAEGKKRLDFTDEELARYGEYSKNDVELTLKLFKILASAFPKNELDLIDMTLRMFTQPVFHVDDALLQDRLVELKEEKLALLQTLMEKLNCKDEEAVRKKLASGKQFAAILTEHGIEVPMKESKGKKSKGEMTYALAKNDEGFLALTEHEDPFIQQLCAVSSTMVLTRAVGRDLIKSISRISPVEIRRKKPSRMQSSRQMTTLLSTATRLRSKHASLRGWQGKKMSLRSLPMERMSTHYLPPTSMTAPYQKHILWNGSWVKPVFWV